VAGIKSVIINIITETTGVGQNIEGMKVIITGIPDAVAATLTGSILAIIVIVVIDYSSSRV
jgi:ABC-type uncharacterized transport system substrate-binding protein